MTVTSMLTATGLSLLRPDARCTATYEQFFTDGTASDGYGGARDLFRLPPPAPGSFIPIQP